MTKHIAIFERRETPIASIVSDLTTFVFLALCILFSWYMGGGFWTFFCACLFLLSLSSRWHLGAGARHSGWVKLKTKREAVLWAASLPDDESTQGDSP